LDTERGLPLGLGCGDYSETQITLSSGSKLVFYSDGITEAENAEQEEYGLSRLAEHAMKPGASAVSIIDEVRSYAHGGGVRDDATAVFVTVTGYLIACGRGALSECRDPSRRRSRLSAPFRRRARGLPLPASRWPGLSTGLPDRRSLPRSLAAGKYLRCRSFHVHLSAEYRAGTHTPFPRGTL